MVPVDLDMLKKALRSIHKEFEDAIQMICASYIPGINYIVTRNTKDFKTSELVVLTPDEKEKILKDVPLEEQKEEEEDENS